MIKANDGWAAFGKFAFGLAMWPVLVVADTFVVHALWGWFVVTSFGAPALAYWQVYGLLVLVNMIKAKVPEYDDDPAIEDRRRGLPERLFLRLGLAGFVYGYGYAVYSLGQSVGQ